MKMFLSKFMVAVALLVSVASGCATTASSGSVMTDAEQVASVIKRYGESLVSQDIDKMMVLVSENFESAAKEDVRMFWINFKESGALVGVDPNFTEAKTEIDGSSAVVGPLFVVSPAGSLTQDFYLSKEADGAWRGVDVLQY